MAVSFLFSGGTGSAAAPALALALGLALELEQLGLPVRLKWPNDLQVGPRKLGGILAEASSLNGDVRFVVLGFGINVLTSSYPPDVAVRATSLEAETGRRFDRGAVLVACLPALETRYRAFEHRDTHAILASWRLRARPHLTRPVRWISSSWAAPICPDKALWPLQGEHRPVLPAPLRFASRLKTRFEAGCAPL